MSTAFVNESSILVRKRTLTALIVQFITICRMSQLKELWELSGITE